MIAPRCQQPASRLRQLLDGQLTAAVAADVTEHVEQCEACRQQLETMAAGARWKLGVRVGLAVTGIAGPGGGSAEKPVGLVYVAVDGPAGPRGRELRLGGTRAQIRERTANLALDHLRRYLLAEEPGAESSR